jgi:diacylglycerol kinase (ATP)
MNIRKEYAIIVNPNAGNQKGQKDWPQIRSILQKHSFDFIHRFTSLQGEAKDICQELIQKGYRKFIAIGGDGTMNEVINGIFAQHEVSGDEFTVGIIPVGTGNDWCRTFDIPNDYEGAIKIIKEGRAIDQDVGSISQDNTETRFFANVAGGGFDAYIAKKVNTVKEKGNGSSWIYLYILLTSLFKYKSTSIEFDIDGKLIKHQVLSFSVGIGKFNGGGMKQLPNAVPNDGLFDVTIIRKMSKLEAIKNIKKLYDGSLIYLDKVEMFEGKTIHIKASPKVDIEIDGESAGYSPATLKILPRSLLVYSGIPK